MPPSAAFAADPYSYADVRAVADDLGLSEPVAVTLVRRGYTTPELARTFLAAEESHPPSAFTGMEDAVDLVLAAIESEQRITVHGDFDVDGVCATALLVSTLRNLGADADWLIPDRIKDGYGLTDGNVHRLAERGTNLLITVDCGITAVDQVALGQSLGMDVLVTDHHQRADTLPSCTVLHPQVSDYPFESLCGTAVAWKLATALREATGMGSPGARSRGVPGEAIPVASADPNAQARDLDLVALATIADLVPLVGENRSLAKRGLAEMRLAQRPGLRALIAASKCEPTQLDESDVAFRLAPRINAAGRLYRADAGVELLLTDDEERAEQIAVELSKANSERRATEREVDSAAEAARRELPDELRGAPGLVVAGEGWHPGVVGIVASRLVERHNRPVVVISLDGEGGARGSGRSIPGFDLLAALRACSEHLGQFGGHRAAAGVSLRAEQLPGFQRAFAAHATAVLGPEPPARTERFDALVGGVGLGLELAEELRQLAPFGLGNPGVRLMVPSARVSDVRTMGAEGKHARFSLHSGAHRALGVAFGRSDLGVESDESVDAAIRLEVNHWNGSVEPRVVLRELFPLEGGEEGEADAAEDSQARLSSHPCECDPAEWWRRFDAELAREPGAPSTDSAPSGGNDASSARLTVRGGGSAVVAIAELVSSGAGVLAVAADASRRAALASGAAGLARFNGGSGRVACVRCGGGALAPLLEKAGAGLALTDYATLAAAPERVASRFEHVVLVDPPASPIAAATAAAPFVADSELSLAAGPMGDPIAPGTPRWGYLHELWTEAEAEFALRVVDESLASRGAVARVFRALREAGSATGEPLREALGGGGAHPLAPEAAARAFRVLAELDLLQGRPEAGGGVVGVVSSGSTDLERSSAFRAYRAQHLEAQQFLARPQTAVEHRELLADLFAVVEEFDSAPSGDGHVNGGALISSGNGAAALAEPNGATATAAGTIDRGMLERAFDFACDRHADQRRYSGDEFITHPVGVAQICAGMRLDTETLCAALLHDTVEDTSASLEEIQEEFGDQIAQLVDGVTKLTGMSFESRDERQAENYRKMMVAMATDVRVILIKLADRLHNMRTLGALPKQKQTAKSHETLEIYAPLAHRLGIHAIKWELEDLAFATLHPRKYAEIKQLVAQQRDERESYVTDAGEFLHEELEEVGIEAEISGRAKHFYSIYTKMAKKGREFNEIFDLTAMRVIVGSVKDCYGAIGVIHSLWKPLPGRFKDFVAMPKANMYQALHTTVIGPEGKPLEIQIRTEEMHKLAEYGIAAHVAYKEGGVADPQRDKMTWLRQLVEAEGEQDPAEFLEALKVDLFEDEVFVFTPKGEVKNLSAGSTPLDFAYAIHTDVGHRTVGAKVNGNIVPLHYQLRSGDIVEVLTAKQNRGPSRDWLKLVRTSRARNKIRAFFKEERREDAERKGRESLDEALRSRGIPMQKIAGSALLADVFREMGYRKATDFYIALGQGKVSTKNVANKLIQRLKQGEAVDEDTPTALVDKTSDRARRTKQAANYGIAVKGADNVAVRLAKCCRPVPGDEIAGYVSLGRGITIHRTDCKNVKALKRAPERFVEVNWEGENEASYRVELQIDAYDRTRLLEDLSRTFSEAGINIIGASCTTNHPMVKNRFVVEVGDTEQLKQCVSRLRNVESVFDAYRITPAA